jgi:hypothetical protein
MSTEQCDIVASVLARALGDLRTVDVGWSHPAT